jgi:UDP-N-acetylglucosamine:LPS N-acetylglucosamine transferase
MANARALERVGGCIVVPDAGVVEQLAGEIRGLAQDADRRRRIGDAAHQLAAPDAAEQIWKICSAWISAAPGAAT